MLFGHREPLANTPLIDEIKSAYPSAQQLGCSTAGELFDVEVWDDSLVVTAIEFEHTEVIGHTIYIDEAGSSYQAGEKLARRLIQDGCVHVFVLSDGLQVNGSDLVKGLVHVFTNDHISSAITCSYSTSFTSSLCTNFAL